MTVEDFFDASHDIFCMAGLDGYFKKVNAAFCSVLGYSEEILLSKPVKSFIHPDDREKTRDALNHLPKNSEWFENRYIASDGTIRHLSWSRIVLSSDNVIYGLARDVTREKLLEEKLQNSLRENQQILDSSLDVIVCMDESGKFVSVSRASQDLWGYAPAELIGTQYRSLVHPEDLEQTLKLEGDLMAGKQITSFENRYVKKSGEIVPLIWSSRWDPLERKYYATAKNAFEKKEQEKLILESERRFRALVQSGFEFISVLDREARYLYVSPTCEKLGYKADFLLGKSPLDFIHKDDRSKVWNAFRRVLSENEVQIPLFRYFDAHGNQHWVSTVATNKFDDPAVGGIVVNSRDVTEKVAIEQEKEKAVARLKNVFYNLTEGYILLNPEWVVIDCNPKAEKLLGMRAAELLNCYLWDVFPQEKDLQFYEQYNKALQQDVFVCFQGYVPSLHKWFEVSAYPYEGALTIFFKDITEAELQRLNLELEKEVLEMSTQSCSGLKDIVDHYLLQHSSIYPDMKCAVKMVDRCGTRLTSLSSPAIHPSYADSTRNGVVIGENAGACGMAAFLKKPVIVEDISLHPYSQSFKDVVLPLGLKSCWSYPIFSRDQEVIGTLAVYHETQKAPSNAEVEIVTRICTFIQILIDGHLIRQRLHISSERYRLATIAAKDAIYDLDLVTNELFWGEGFQKVLGYQEDSTNLTWWEARIHPQDISGINNSLNDTIADKEKKYWRGEYRFLKADGLYAYIIDDGYIIRNDDGVAVRMVGAMQDITERRNHQEQILKQNSLLREIAQINSHYIRKPLANIMGLITAVKFADDTSKPELIDLLEKSGLELDEIIRDIAKKAFV